MKKEFVLGLFLLVLILPLASALDLRYAASTLVDWTEQIFAPFFEVLLGASQFDQYFFARVLLLMLLYVVILTVLKRTHLFERTPFAYILVSAIVSVLGTRYMSEVDFIEGILLPYGAMAIAISVFLPFLIFFLFTHFSIPGAFGRRAAWIVFGIIFLALWLTRQASAIGIYNYVYIAGIVAVIISFIFDRQIHTYFALAELRRGTRNMRDSQRVRMLNEYQTALNTYNQTGDQAAERVMRRLARQLRINAGERFEHGAGI